MKDRREKIQRSIAKLTTEGDTLDDDISRLQDSISSIKESLRKVTNRLQQNDVTSRQLQLNVNTAAGQLKHAQDNYNSLKV